MIRCKVGDTRSFYEEHRAWLREDSSRRLFLVEEGKIPSIEDRQVKGWSYSLPFQRRQVAQQIGWMSVLRPLEIIDEEWRSEVLSFQLAAELLLADASDFGVRVARPKKERPLRSLLQLQGALEGIPAVIVGAGPSMRESRRHLASWKQGALLIGAGQGSVGLDVPLHLNVAIDPDQPVQMKSEVGCILSRTHSQSLQRAKELFYLPDSHFLFDGWLMGEGGAFEGGWTAGNTATAIAVHLGCNPIVLVGMDSCYEGKQKYAGKKGPSAPVLIQTNDRNGEPVWTQRDWLLALRWFEEYSERHPAVSFMNGTHRGLHIGGRFSQTDDLSFPPNPTIESRWNEAVLRAPLIQRAPHRLGEWIESLGSRRGIAVELLFEPLWNLWGPLFERELMGSEDPLPMEERLALQKEIFFDQIAQEHLAVIPRPK